MRPPSDWNSQECLKKIRKTISYLKNVPTNLDTQALIEQFEHLDEWLSNNGEFPLDWKDKGGGGT
jgi:hypothetical protein